MTEYDVMYGIEVPPDIPIDNEKLFAFIENHKGAIVECENCDTIPTTPYDVYEWLDEYEDYMGNTGIGALIRDVIGEMYIETTHDKYGSDYIGMYAASIFPWNGLLGNYAWTSITPEYIKGKIRPIVEELFGECPEFDEYVIWNCG